MAYNLTFAFDGAATGVTPLRAMLVDTAGADVGTAITTGFVEIGSNFYMATISIPDAHAGGVKFYDNDAPSTILAFAAINPQEAEYTDAKTSTRSSHTAANVRTEMDTSSTKLATIAGYVDELETRLTAARAAAIDELLAANLPADIDTLLTRISGILTAATIADAVLDEAISGHATAGTVGAAFTTLLADHAADTGTGDGDVEVDHDTGGADTLRVTMMGNGVDGATIRAYLTSEVTASGFSGATIKGTTRTGSDGRWIAPLMLDAGTYTLVVTTSDGSTLSSSTSVTVA